MKYLNKPTKKRFSRNYSDFPAYAGKKRKNKAVIREGQPLEIKKTEGRNPAADYKIPR